LGEKYNLLNIANIGVTPFNQISTTENILALANEAYEMSKQIGALPGETITLVSPVGKLTPLGRVPNEETFIIKGLFESGMYDYDSSLVYLSLADAQNFLSP